MTASHTSHTNNNYATHAHRHVRFAAGVHGLSHRVDQVAADAKVAHLDLALSVDQHVGGLHIYGGTETTRQTLKIRLMRSETKYKMILIYVILSPLMQHSAVSHP